MTSINFPTPYQDALPPLPTSKALPTSTWTAPPPEPFRSVTWQLHPHPTASSVVGLENCRLYLKTLSSASSAPNLSSLNEMPVPRKLPRRLPNLATSRQGDTIRKTKRWQNCFSRSRPPCRQPLLCRWPWPHSRRLEIEEGYDWLSNPDAGCAHGWLNGVSAVSVGEDQPHQNGAPTVDLILVSIWGLLQVHTTVMILVHYYWFVNGGGSFRGGVSLIGFCHQDGLMSSFRDSNEWTYLLSQPTSQTFFWLSASSLNCRHHYSLTKKLFDAVMESIHRETRRTIWA